MRFCITILAFVMWVNCFGQTTYYVRTTGDDAFTVIQAQNPATPWKTVYKATSTIVGNSLIDVGAGVFNEPLQLILAPSVKMTGVDSIQTKLVLSYYDSSISNASILLSSGSVTPGNQYIKNMWIDGNFTSYNCILVFRRSHVEVRNVKLTNFRAFAVNLNNTTVGVPATYADSNRFIASTITNCGDRAKVGGAGLLMSGQHGTILDSVRINNSGKAITHNGNCISMIQGHNKGIKILNSVFTKPLDDGGPNFCIESWREDGGYEVAYCTFNGGGNLVDAGTEGSVKGAYAYNWWVHDNVFQMASQLPTTPTGMASIGFQFEDDASDGLIEHNTFRNLGIGIMISDTHGPDVTQRHTINNNLFENIGYLDGSYGGWGAIYILIKPQPGYAAGAVCRDLNIYNNTIILNKAHSGLFLSAAAGCFIRNVTFTNNIVRGVTSWGYITFDGSNITNGIDSVASENNFSWLNSSSNDAYYRAPQTSSTVTNFVTTVDGVLTGPIKQDPQFVSTTSFYLSPGSPAITGGLNPPNTYNGAFPVSGTNIDPVASAGSDQTFNQGTSSTTLTGSGSDADGTIAFYSWTQTAGPAATIVNPSSATTNVTGLFTATTYTFQLTVTDNQGATHSDLMDIVVTPIVSLGGLQGFIITKEDEIYRPIL